jgi:hypothetical protein
VRVDAFEVGKHDIAIERVRVLCPGVLHYRVRYHALVVADEVAAASRTRLVVGHGRIMPDQESSRRVPIDQAVMGERNQHRAV